MDVDFKTNILVDLSSLRRSGDFCDIVLLTSEGDRIPCHKNVLASNSSYFKLLLSGGATQMQEGSALASGEPVNVAVGTRTMESLVCACYGETIKIDLPNLVELLKFSQLMGMDRIFNAICTHLEAGHCASFFYFNLFIQNPFHGTKKLQVSCIKVIIDHFDVFSQSDDFVRTPSHILPWILARIDRSKTSEGTILSAICKWGEAHNYCQGFFAMLAHINFESLNVLKLFSLKRLVPSLPAEYSDNFDSFINKALLQKQLINYEPQRRSNEELFSVSRPFNKDIRVFDL